MIPVRANVISYSRLVGRPVSLCAQHDPNKGGARGSDEQLVQVVVGRHWAVCDDCQAARDEAAARSDL